MKKSPKETLAICCQTAPNLAESCQTLPPEESPPKSGASKAKRGETKQRKPKSGEPESTDQSSRELKPNQQRALLALLEAPSVAAAARQSGIGERTIHRWLHEDFDFQDEFREKRRQRLDHAATRLQSTAGQAVQAIVDLLASKDPIEPGRAALVRTALDFAFRAGSYIDLAERLEMVEREARRQKEEGSADKTEYDHTLGEDFTPNG